MSDLHEVVFRWPYNAKEAIVTGSFDQWTRSVRMNTGPSGFSATVQVPWEEKVLYKFIVDGSWATTDQAPTEADWRGNINNVYHAPTKPEELDTPRYEPPAAQEPVIAPVPVKEKEEQVPTPAPVEKKDEPASTPTPKPTDKGSVEVPAKPQQPAKDKTPVVEKKEPSPPADPVPVVPVNDTKPVDTPPAKTNRVTSLDNVPAVLPTPPNLKAPLVIVPVNDATVVEKQPPVVELPKHIDTPSTHALPINSPRKASIGTSSSNTLSVEKKEEEKTEPTPKVSPPNGTTNGVAKTEEPAQQPPPTPDKDTPHTPPPVPVTPPRFTSPPTTPRKTHFPGSTSSSPTSSPSNTISRKSSFKKKRETFIHKVKHLFTPEKDKEHHHHHREKSHD